MTLSAVLQNALLFSDQEAAINQIIKFKQTKYLARLLSFWDMPCHLLQLNRDMTINVYMQVVGIVDVSIAICCSLL